MAHPPNIWLSYKQAISTHCNLRQKEINFPFRHLIRHTNPSKSFLKPASSRFRPKINSYLRKMSILPDCRVFDYSANFSTHDSTVPNKTPRGIPMVLCVRSSVRDCGRVRERATSSNYRFTQQIKNIDDSLKISGYIRSPRAIEADRRYTGKYINGINLTWQHSSIKNVKLKKNDFNLELRAFRICIQYLEYSRYLQFSSALILL